MNTQRALAVFAAIMIVSAVALGTLEVRPVALGQLLARLDSDLPNRLHTFVVGLGGDWARNGMAMPLLRRPAWLSPASLALLAIGLALSLPGRKTAHRSRHRN
ncbi:MAG: hypothetical protein WCI94_06410 [Rhodospirillales bacterium]